MPVLSNSSIFEALNDGRLVIDPEPEPRFTELGGPTSPYDNTSVDLTLAKHLQIPKRNLKMTIDLREEGDIAETIGTISTTEEIHSEQGWKLEPYRFVLGQTVEGVALRLPEDFGDDAQGRPCLAARVEGKSSRARFGLLVHFTAPTVHAGFGRPSPLTLEMMNLGTASITLYEGMRICQLIIEEVRGAPASNPSDFDNQRTPAGQA